MQKGKILDKEIENPPYDECTGMITEQIGDQTISKPCKATLTWERVKLGKSIIVRTTCSKCGQYDYQRER